MKTCNSTDKRVLKTKHSLKTSLIMLLSEKDIAITIDEDAKEYLAQKGYNPIYGARPLKRTIRQLVENPMSKAILKQEIKSHSKVKISVDNDELTFTQE